MSDKQEARIEGLTPRQAQVLGDVWRTRGSDYGAGAHVRRLPGIARRTWIALQDAGYIIEIAPGELRLTVKADRLAAEEGW